MTEEKILKINAIQTNKGYYISLTPDGNHDRSINGYLYDGEYPKPSFNKDWFIIPDAPKRISKKIRQDPINRRYHLIDESLQSAKIPLEIPKSEAGGYAENDYHFVWVEQYAPIAGLYEEIWDEQPELDEDVACDFNVLMAVPEITDPPDFRYAIEKRYNSYESQWVQQSITRVAIHYQELATIIYPDVLLHETPSYLSSEDTYKIVRQYVKENINPKVAHIESDYDFCFTVSKVIPLGKPYTAHYENIFRRKGSRPKLTEKYITTKEVKCFEMTYFPKNYEKYTPIKSFSGKTEQDLKEQIDQFLLDLITFINEPMKECSRCNGVGVLFNSEVEPVFPK